MAESMFIENLGRFSDALGIMNTAAIVHLSLIPWPDPDTRDQFIKDLSGYDPRSGVT